MFPESSWKLLNIREYFRLEQKKSANKNTEREKCCKTLEIHSSGCGYEIQPLMRYLKFNNRHQNDQGADNPKICKRFVS